MVFIQYYELISILRICRDNSKQGVTHCSFDTTSNSTIVLTYKTPVHNIQRLGILIGHKYCLTSTKTACAS